MSARFPDPRSEVEALLIRLLRVALPWRKMEMAGQMNATVKGLMRLGLEGCYSHDTPEQIHRRMADVLLTSELALKVYASLIEDDHTA